MNELVEKGYISEMMCGNNLTYILNEDSLFLTTEYKVLLSQGENSFVKCMKMLYNGKIQLFYLTEGYRSLISLLPQLDVDRFIALVTNLIADVIEVHGNGFLSCPNIELDFEHMYVDLMTYKLKLIYLPLSKHNYHDYAGFESSLRSELCKLISGVDNLASPKTMQLSVDLSNATLSLEKVYEKLKGFDLPTPKPKYSFTPDTGTPGRSLQGRLIALDAPVKIELPITKPEFLIGKKGSVVDGVLGYNPKISREHCKIVHNENGFFILDVGSSNGTFVNGARVLPQQMCALSNGDRIRLATSNFVFEIN